LRVVQLWQRAHVSDGNSTSNGKIRGDVALHALRYGVRFRFPPIDCRRFQAGLASLVDVFGR
jgi:hypothetical protein